MNPYLIAAIVFVAGYLVNIFYITVLYHRGLTHQSVILKPFVVTWIKWTGIWVTGLDPKAWACMHRRHHAYSDTDQDPHSPQVYGIFGVALEQLYSYENILRGLIRKKSDYTRLVADIPFDVSILNRKKLWILPYLLHLMFGVTLGVFTHPIIGLAYFTGIMSHPVQGWLVNALAHKYGYRNFSIKDHSTNNWLVSLLVFGEGYQNNHHARPRRANFAIHSLEIDFGYMLCVVANKIGLLTFRTSGA